MKRCRDGGKSEGKDEGLDVSLKHANKKEYIKMVYVPRGMGVVKSIRKDEGVTINVLFSFLKVDRH